MKSALWSLQVAIKSRLDDNTSLNQRITGVLDKVDSGQAFPYVRIGEDTSQPWGSATFDGEEVTSTLHVFSDYNGKKEAKEIISLILQALEEPLTLDSGFLLEFSNVEFMQVFDEDEGKIQHGVVRVRFTISQ
jgi:hypothetical protein